jgi:hypothetical protein
LLLFFAATGLFCKHKLSYIKQPPAAIFCSLPIIAELLFSTTYFFNFYDDFFLIPLKNQEWKRLLYLPLFEVRENPTSK